VHTRKELPYPIENGVGDFLSPAALKTLAVEYQQGLLERLSDEVKGTAQETKSVAQTVIDTAPDRTKTLAFNYASQALNNSFFLDFLKPPPAEAYSNEGEMSQKLGAAIRDDFGSLDQLKSTVSAAAMGLSSSGWIWFATDQRGYTGVIPTFGSGTLLVRSRTMMESPMGSTALGESLSRTPQKTSSATWSQPPPTSPTSGLVPPASSAPHNPQTPLSRSLHSSSAWAAPNAPIYTSKAVGLHGSDTDGNAIMGHQDEGIKFNSIGSTLYPLFCVNVHEHAWMGAGYGIWGKEEYLKRFWTVLDWKKVSEAYAKFSPDRI